MNNQPMYFPYTNYPQQPYYHMQTPGYQSFEDTRELSDDVYRPDDAEDAPTSAPPQQQPSVPSAFYAPAQPGQIRSLICNCLGRWGVIGLKEQGPFGRDFWFYPTEVRTNGVSGYTWQAGRRRKVSYRYTQIRNFMCVS